MIDSSLLYRTLARGINDINILCHVEVPHSRRQVVDIIR